MNEDTWHRARLIPISGLGGQEEKERRSASALLAVLGAVKEFGRANLAPLGAPAGTISTYCEVPFELADDRKFRVDGLIRVQRGKRIWTLLVEVKTGTAELTRQQIENYLEIVRENDFDGLLTISNQIVQVAGHHPIKVGRKFKKAPLFHASWTRILTLAQMVKEHQGVSDPDQAWILGELIRYLQFEGSGAVAFEDMGPNWVAVRSAAREETLRLSDDGVEEIAGRWDQLVQFLCLDLAARLGQEVRPVLSRKELDDPDSRTVALARELIDSGTFSAGIRIPNTVGPIHLGANLRNMTATASIELTAPELKRSSARVNWLLRQLRSAPPELRLDVAFHRTRATSSDLLGRITEDTKRLLKERDHAPRLFTLALSSSVGSKRRSGKGSFIGDISSLLDRFYRDVVQDLKAWTPPTPQLQPQSAPSNSSVPVGSSSESPPHGNSEEGMNS